MPQSEETTLALLQQDIKNIKNDIAEIMELLRSLKKDYVTREEFSPVKTLVYSFVGLVLLSVMGAIVALVLK